jgi:hypothetical protein
LFFIFIGPAPNPNHKDAAGKTAGRPPRKNTKSSLNQVQRPAQAAANHIYSHYNGNNAKHFIPAAETKPGRLPEVP